MSLLFIIIVIAIIVYSYTKQQGQNSENRTNQRMWAEAAHYHGLKLYPASERSVFPAMNGTVDGVSVEIWGDFDDNGHGLIFCKAIFAQSLPFQLSIIKGDFNEENIGSAFEIRGLTAPGITVRASDRKQLNAFLNGQNMNVLKNCIGSSQVAKMTDSYLILGVAGINDGMKVYGFIERAAAAAKTLSCTRISDLPAIPMVDDLEKLHTPTAQVQAYKPVAPKVEAVPEDPAPQEICKPAEPEKEVVIPEVKTVEQKYKPDVPEEKPAPPQFKPVYTPKEPAPEVPAEELLDLSAEGLSKALFSASFPGEKEKALFQKVIGQTIQWRGTLKSVYPYSTDFVFGKGPGTKAVFEICEIASSYGMKAKIKATVSFGEEAMSVLKGQTGKEFAFMGTLLKMEGFSKEILVEKGSLTE